MLPATLGALGPPHTPPPARRAVLGLAASALSAPHAAHANADPTLTAVSTLNAGADFTTLPSGVKVKEIRAGAGPAAELGDVVAVQYSGRCLNLNGKKFISTQDAAALTTGLTLSEPYVFTVGQGAVIPGLEQAVVGMSKDSYRRIVVPQALGYDTAMTLGPTPGSFEELRALESIVKNPNRDASLLFDVKVERVRPGK